MFIESDSSCSLPLLLWFLTKRVAIKKLKVIQNKRVYHHFIQSYFVSATFSLDVINTLNEVKAGKHINRPIHEKVNKFSRNELISKKTAGMPPHNFAFTFHCTFDSKFNGSFRRIAVLSTSNQQVRFLVRREQVRSDTKCETQPTGTARAK